MPTTIHSILEEFRIAATSNRDLGDRFEKLIATYLKTDPLYQDKYSDVWLWGEWPLRANRPDTGIDLVARERYTGEYCAIQCKFYDPNHTLQKADIDSFFTASGKAPFTSRIIISTTDKWSVHAEAALQNQHTAVSRIRVQDLDDSPIDWSHYSLNRPQDIAIKPKKSIRPHQELALNKVIDGFSTSDRGKLIMACGTGKTFTALKIAESLASPSAVVLFLVPSISLLSQSLREWTAESEKSLHSFAICSDTQVGKRSESEDISTHDLAFPATTDAKKLVQQMEVYSGSKQLTVVFSTYQSIKAVSDAQGQGFPDFDLIICDEAHRTTGVTLAGEDESHFVKVHDAKFIKAKKRLYMTATPRIFGDVALTQAQENDAVLCSMDDPKLYGPEFHRLGFGEAVGSGLLSDYKVMVLAVDEAFVSNAFQSQIADSNNEINLDDAVKITGCWNGLSKRITQASIGVEGIEETPAPMRRAVAFSRSIKDSNRFKSLFGQIVDEYQIAHSDEAFLSCEVEHVDGTMNALKRNEMLDWLKADTRDQGNVCRILSNARCLSEGVDVPALDAVLFLNPRNSVVDVVQSVGRVMRKAQGKQYGYIILPIGIPTDIEPEEALQKHEKYKVVWQVLQALRAHDDRFNTTVNQIELNKARTDQIQVIGVGGGSGDAESQAKKGPGTTRAVQFDFGFPHIDEWRDAIFAKIVQKCGDRRYWESWAKDVADIAQRHEARIKALIQDSHPESKAAFAKFLQGLQDNLNPSIGQDEAIEMLSQHMISKPVFDALFGGYEFTQHNPVSVAMQSILDILEGQALEKETKSLEKFYASVQQRASGIDNAEGKQRIILELYDKFFRAAFPKVAERLGIVNTPVEIVDFILRSADEALRSEFGVGISDEGVHVIDPFTGTGTFVARLLASGLIRSEDIERKYRHELHANEIVLLAYYIAAINIEEVYHGIAQTPYQPFEGIVLTDTFQMTEGRHTLGDDTFQANSDRATAQNKIDIRVVVGNPPYSAQQDSENDNNQNISYPQLDEKIRQTYAAASNAKLKKNLYDSYVRAIRWASDRVKDKGIVSFVTNGSFLDANNMDGLRICLAKEFSTVYCFNLRGNARTQGEERRKEKGNVFGGGSRTPVAITLLVKNPDKVGHQCDLHYYDIGDYLSREEKLNAVGNLKSVQAVTWQQLEPNINGDWINQRSDEFGRFTVLGEKASGTTASIFQTHSQGVLSSRDSWAYSFSSLLVASNIKRMIDSYNIDVDKYQQAKSKTSHTVSVESVIDSNPTKVSWSRALKQAVGRGKRGVFDPTNVVRSVYRPFTRQWMYFDRNFNEMVYLMPSFFPTPHHTNLVIAVTGIGASKDFSALIADGLPNYHLLDTGQSYPLHYYEKVANGKTSQSAMFGSDDVEGDYRRKDGISEWALNNFRDHYHDKAITKEDIFYYVYGILHSAEYKKRFASDLKKILPRIPMAQDFWVFSKAGHDLATWHLNYETVEPYPVLQSSDRFDFDPQDQYRVRKMTFGKKNGKPDKSVIVYNSHITLSGIPEEAYEYFVNGKPALEWIMERYQVTRDKDSLIENDPNEYSDDPIYILNLVKRVVRVSLETVQIVKSLPPLNESVCPV